MAFIKIFLFDLGDNKNGMMRKRSNIVESLGRPKLEADLFFDKVDELAHLPVGL